MPLFLSTYVNKVDAKGRLSIPAPFRAALGDDFSGVVLFCSPKHPCLEGFSMKAMERMAMRLDRFDMFSSEQDDMATSVFGAARPLALDGQGRIVLPEELKAYASLGGHAAIVGMGFKFQVWDPSAFDQRKQRARLSMEAGSLTIPYGESGLQAGE